MPKKKRKIITGLDIGTTKVCAIIGEPDPHTRDIKVLGLGSNPSRGLKRGMVIDIDDTVESIRQAVYKAEEQAQISIKDVFIGLSGEHISSFNSSGVVEVTNPVRGVSRTDIARAIEKAKQLTTPFDREIIHCIPQEFVCDGQSGIRNPLDISCSRLEVRMHIVTAAITSAQNIIRCVQQAGFRVRGLLLQSLASSLALLSEEEKDLGILLVDIGGGTTDIALFYDGSVRFTTAIPFGGDNITNDIKLGIRVPMYDAENLKKKYGRALASSVDPEETVEIKTRLNNNPLKINRHYLAEIIQARVEEILLLAKERLEKNGLLEHSGAGIVLTGGSALLDGIIELSEKIFELPVRLGTPRGLKGISSAVTSPIYATGIGLVIYGNSDNYFPRLRPRNLFAWLMDVFRRFIDWEVFGQSWPPTNELG
ncbi:cell division protein FtsA [Candidatus Sumerlaeota bacterium]|nr:cell division protein FtsA [Candidatus Sumerlaeota bacterium]